MPTLQARKMLGQRGSDLLRVKKQDLEVKASHGPSPRVSLLGVGLGLRRDMGEWKTD
jgi:hypothetical protein